MEYKDPFDDDLVESDKPAPYGSDLWVRRFIKDYIGAKKITKNPKEKCWIAFKAAEEKSFKKQEGEEKKFFEKGEGEEYFFF